MPITKAASDLLAMRELLEKRAELDAPALTAAQAASTPAKTGFFGRASRFSGPLLTSAFAAQGIMSGQQSVGEAIGDAAGGWAGYELASKAFDKLLPATGRLGLIAKGVRGVGKFVTGIAGGLLGSSAASAVGDKLAPLKRPQQTPQQYFGDTQAPADYANQWQQSQVGM